MIEWPDGKQRCKWANPKNHLYLQYHDHEWGVPVHDDARLLEMLLLENFQAGLSWECVLNKRARFRQVFDNFDLDKICAYGNAKVNALCEDKGIIRNRLKIASAIENARIFRRIQEQWNGFNRYLWHWSDNSVIREQCRLKSPLSDAISADLRQKGMKFTGSVIIYSYLQAVGVIYGHEPGCFLERLRKA